MAFDIRIYGDPVLRKTAETVRVFDEGLQRFTKEMVEAMLEKDGVGLAANQVGRPVQCAVIDVTRGENDPLVLINPVIFFSSDDLVEEEEGCLSIPTIRLPVKRPLTVSAKAQDINGREYAIERATGLLARALQHEIDHLNGILFIDHLSPLRRRLISGALKKLAKTGGSKK
ncbi:MAG: peptide deformylase [Chitinispirillaceae bacterium]|nr:peptide deformylase [Chitinispirillaceae bacterium]